MIALRKIGIFLLFSWLFSLALSKNLLQIVELRVPHVVENGSASSVILDCDYLIEKSDKNFGLVVQWYFENHSAPVYQWIPGKPPQDWGILKGRINLDYRASEDENKKHRALEILQPTIDLSGEYRCKVATYEEEHIAAKTMTVYAPPKNLEVWHQKATMDSVNVTCRAEGIYPQPRLQLFQSSPLRTEIEGPTADIVQHNGLYDVTLHRLVQDKSLRHETSFECVLSIPNTEYQIKRTVIYYPGPGSVTAGSGHCFIDSLWITSIAISTSMIFFISTTA